MTDRILNKWLELELKIMRDNTGLNLEISKNSPGDGWTRYRLTEVDPKTGGENDILGFTALTRNEVYYAMKVFNRTLERMNNKQQNLVKEIEA